MSKCEKVIISKYEKSQNVKIWKEVKNQNMKKSKCEKVKMGKSQNGKSQNVKKIKI